jgi:hypothetical protein
MELGNSNTHEEWVDQTFFYLATVVRLYSSLAKTYLIEQQLQSEIACPALFASLLVKENVKNPGRQ